MQRLPVNIRLATRNDAVTIADVSRSTFYDTFAPYNSHQNMTLFLDQQFTRGRLIDEVSHGENTFLLAYCGEDLAGYVKLREGQSPRPLHPKRTLEIARLYVVAPFIGRGVGSCLMQSSINIARERNADVVWLAVWENNLRAFSFYQRWGFEIFGSQVFLLGRDLQKDWLMQCCVTGNT